MENSLEKNAKKVGYAAVGAVVELSEKAQEIIEKLAVVGEAACEKMKTQNEELKNNLKEKASSIVKVTVETTSSVDGILEQMNTMDEEALTKIKEKLASLEKVPSEEA